MWSNPLLPPLLEFPQPDVCQDDASALSSYLQGNIERDLKDARQQNQITITYNIKPQRIVREKTDLWIASCANETQ